MVKQRVKQTKHFKKSGSAEQEPKQLWYWPQHQMSWIPLYVKMAPLYLVSDCGMMWQWLILRRNFFFFSYIQCLIWTETDGRNVSF